MNAHSEKLLHPFKCDSVRVSRASDEMGRGMIMLLFPQSAQGKGNKKKKRVSAFPSRRITYAFQTYNSPLVTAEDNTKRNSAVAAKQTSFFLLQTDNKTMISPPGEI